MIEITKASVLYFVFTTLSFLVSKTPLLSRRRTLENRYPLHVEELNDYLFEVSSEGELEMIFPLLEALAAGHHPFTLLLCSPSLEKKISGLKANFPDAQVAYLPLATDFGRWNQWQRSLWRHQNKIKKIIFCRYDFFPHLFLPQVDKIGISLIVPKNKWKRWWYFRLLYPAFKIIYTPLDAMGDVLKSVLPPSVVVQVYEPRLLQICRRLEYAAAKLDSLPMVSHLKKYGGAKLILGSCYQEDLALLQQPRIANLLAQKKMIVLLAPHHHFSAQNFLLSDEVKSPLLGGEIIYFKERGYLTELYTLFDVVYVGGGFGRSVHSLLEPVLTGARLCCGYKIHRSTEYLWIKDHLPHSITLLDNYHSEGFSDLLLEIVKIGLTKKPYYLDDGFKDNLQKLNRQLVTQIISARMVYDNKR